MDCKDIINYISQYQIAYDKILSLIKKNSAWISKKVIKLTFQGNFIKYFAKDYLILVIIIKTQWKKETTSLSNIVLKVIRYAKIYKRNKKNTANNISIVFAIET